MILRISVIIMFSINLAAGAAYAATLEVGQGQAYTTIQSALDAAKSGDTIKVHAGTYVENARINTGQLTIIGDDKERTIIDGGKKISGLRIDQVNDIIISGFTVVNSGGSGREDGGVTIYMGSNNTVSNLILKNNTAGITIYQGSSNNVISGNDIEFNYNNGIYIYGSNDNKIYNNNINNNKFGIYSDSARTNSIYQNNLINNNFQAYDNSNLNLWDNDKIGNYWSDYKGSGEYDITLGNGKAKDNYPAAKAFIIRTEAIPEAPSQTAGTTGKPTPGFSVIVSIVSILIIIAFRNRKKGVQDNLRE